MASVDDWLRLRPLLAQYKLARRKIIGRAFLSKPAPDPGAFLRCVSNLGAKPLLLTIAYNTVWMLDWQIKFGKLHFRDVDRLVADNSSNEADAKTIEGMCAQVGIAYIRLPFNRFSLGRPKDSSLSHAVALNWVFRNVVRPAGAPIVAILDHDLIPMQPVDFASKVAMQPFFGVKSDGLHGAWQIWPGYAVYSRAIIERYDLDFWTDSSVGLDCGGANWKWLFSQVDISGMRFAQPPDIETGRVEEWWHVGRASEHIPMPPGWRQQVEAKLQAEYEALMAATAA